MPFNEEQVITQIANQERTIGGVKTVYGYAQNPDSLPAADLPAVVHYVASFDNTLRANFNLWKVTLNLRSILFVAPRMDQGGKLKFIENAAIPFGQKWRTKFQDDTVISTLLSNLSSVKVFLKSGNYGAGGTELQYGGVDYLGWTFSWDIVSA